MKHSYRVYILSSVLAFTAWGSLPPPALAQQGSQIALEEIVVTSRKREESLLDIPIAVTAFSDSKLYELNMTDLVDLSRMTPGFHFEQSSFVNAYRFLPQARFRGMNPPSSGPAFQIGAIFVDGVFTVGDASSLATDDVERIEVIKGPQSAYFGRQTFGGAVNFITRTPGDEFVGQAKGKLETKDSYEVGASVEGPVIENVLGVRLMAKGWQRGAHYIATDGGELGTQRSELLTGALYFTPSENFSAKLRASYGEDHDFGNAVLSFRPDTSQPGGPHFTNCQLGVRTWWCGPLPNLNEDVPVTGGTVFLSETLISNDTSLRHPQLFAIGQPDALINMLANQNGELDTVEFIDEVPGIDHFGSERTVKRFIGSFDYNFDNDYTLAGNFGYGKMDFASVKDVDNVDGLMAGGRSRLVTYTPYVTADYSGELRLSSPEDQSLRGLIGGNFLKQRIDGNLTGGGVSVDLNSGAVIPTVNNSRDRSRVYGVFAALSYDITDQLTFDAEGRYQVDKLRNFAQVSVGVFDPIFTTFKEFMPRAILSYQPTEETNVYASYARGALPGIANSLFESLINNIVANPGNRLGTTNPDEIRSTLAAELGADVQLVLDSEKIDNFEVGWKQQFWDGRAYLALSGYHYKWKNFKQTFFVFVPDLTGDGVTDAILARIPGAARAYGLEWDLSLRPIDGLSVDINGEYVDAKFTDFEATATIGRIAGSTDLKGKHLIQYPEYTLAANVRYEDNLGGDWNWYVNGQATRTGRQYSDEANLSWIGSYTIVNARAGIFTDDVNLEFYVDNLLAYDGFIGGRRSTASNGETILYPIPTRKAQLRHSHQR